METLELKIRISEIMGFTNGFNSRIDQFKKSDFSHNVRWKNTNCKPMKQQDVIMLNILSIKRVLYIVFKRKVNEPENRSIKIIQSKE